MHCRNQHDFDPMSNQAHKKYAFSKFTDSESKNRLNSGSFASQKAVKRIINLMNDLSRFRALRRGPVSDRVSEDRRRPDYAILNRLVNNYIIVPKRDISGISGHLCRRCCTFEFRYIKDIGSDLTASETHICDDTIQEKSNLYREQIRPQLIKQKSECLLNLANLLFRENKFLVVEPTPVHEETYHAHSIRLAQIGPEHWALKPLIEEKMWLSQYDLSMFLDRMNGSYARLIVESGEYSGEYLMHVM